MITLHPTLPMPVSVCICPLGCPRNRAKKLKVQKKGSQFKVYRHGHGCAKEPPFLCFVLPWCQPRVIPYTCSSGLCLYDELYMRVYVCTCVYAFFSLVEFIHLVYVLRGSSSCKCWPWALEGRPNDVDRLLTLPARGSNFILEFVCEGEKISAAGRSPGPLLVGPAPGVDPPLPP